MRQLAQRFCKLDAVERELRLAGLRAEREEIYRFARLRRISDDMTHKLVREIDLLEARFSAG